MKHLPLTLSLVSALALAACAPSADNGDQQSSASSSSAARSSASSVQQQDLINVTQPLPNDVVASPLTVTGEARGNWYFEASFPVRLIDGDGNELAVVPAQAQGDWMTTDFVPFEVTLTFDRPSTPFGALILEKDNPSGLPENAAFITVPVRF